VKKLSPTATASRRPLLTLRCERLETISLRRSIFSQPLSVGFFAGQRSLRVRRSYAHVQGLRHRRVDDALPIHQRRWWMKKASATRPDPPYTALVARVQSGGNALSTPLDCIRASVLGHFVGAARFTQHRIHPITLGHAQQPVADRAWTP